MDVKSLVIGILSTVIIVMSIAMLIMRHWYDTQVLLNYKSEQIIGIYNQCLENNNNTLELILSAQGKLNGKKKY